MISRTLSGYQNPAKPSKMSLGSRLKAERKRLAETQCDRKLTQNDLAEMLAERGVLGAKGKPLTFGAIGHWENNREVPSASALRALAAIYGRTVSFLLEEWDEDVERLVQATLEIARKR